MSITTRVLFLGILCCAPLSSLLSREECCHDSSEQSCECKEEPPKTGNFSLPTSQQPATLFGFGGNIIDAGETQLLVFADDFEGKKRRMIDVIPSVLYGINDKWSIFFNFPFTPLFKDHDHKSRGLLDFFVQLEYAFYDKSTSTYVDQATILANVTAPTGSRSKNPPTGFGSPSVFLGGTFYRMMTNWFMFAAPGVLLPTSYHGTKFGNQYLYQCGFGRNIPSPEGWIYAWMVDIDGMYSSRNRVDGSIDRNSGGNVIFVTPSLWISSRELTLQFGVSLPVYQNLFGSQRRFDYALNFNFSWSFYSTKND